MAPRGGPGRMMAYWHPEPDHVETYHQSNQRETKYRLAGAVERTRRRKRAWGRRQSQDQAEPAFSSRESRRSATSTTWVTVGTTRSRSRRPCLPKPTPNILAASTANELARRRTAVSRRATANFSMQSRTRRPPAQGPARVGWRRIRPQGGQRGTALICSLFARRLGR